MLDHLVADLKAVIFRDRDPHAIPVMDGPFSPNAALDRARELGDPIAAPDEMALGPDGALYISSGRSILRCTGPDFAERATFAAFDTEIGPLAFQGERLLAGAAGGGLLALDRQGRTVATVSGSDDGPIACPTALCVGADGTVYLTDGSSRHGPAAWCRDLMENNALGRLIVIDPALSQGRTMERGLAWPGGVALTADGTALWYGESWRHCLLRRRVTPEGLGTREVVVPNLPGYPARLAPARDGGFWLALFAVRTHLVELVLREKRYRQAMMETIDPALWIAPALHSDGGYLEPLQGGGIKKLGIRKPWAPPRSYGLVARLDANGDVVESLHSRVGGLHHGITAAREADGRLLILSKGNDRLLERAGEDER